MSNVSIVEGLVTTRTNVDQETIARTEDEMIIMETMTEDVIQARTEVDNQMTQIDEEIQCPDKIRIEEIAEVKTMNEAIPATEMEEMIADNPKEVIETDVTEGRTAEKIEEQVRDEVTERSTRSTSRKPNRMMKHH